MEKPLAATSGQRLKIARAEAGFRTQFDLAAESGIARGTIAAMETDKDPGGRDAWIAVALATRRSLDWLLLGTEDALESRAEGVDALGINASIRLWRDQPPAVRDWLLRALNGNLPAPEKMESVRNRDEFWCAHTLRVRYSEIDRQGYVFNAHYLAYFDTAITEYFRALGYDYAAQLAAAATDFHVVRAEVLFRAPIGFDETLAIGCRAARLGRTSVTFALAVFAETAPELRAEGTIVHVNTDQTTGRPAPLPDDFRARVLARETAVECA